MRRNLLGFVSLQPVLSLTYRNELYPGRARAWKKSCGDNCPGFYKVYMNCLGHFGGGGMGPHCYLNFWCTKSNTDDTYHDC